MFWDEIYGGYRPATGYEVSEDCLHLNIWAPLKADGSLKENLAVMAFIHGGAYFSLSANFNLFEGIPLAMATGNIIVTLNYRLGALGRYWR